MSDFLTSNPVSNLYPDFCGDIGSLGFCCIKALALGKSTLVTLIGLHSLLREDTVLHVSLKAPQQHVRKRYDHVLESLLVATNTTESVDIRKSIEQKSTGTFIAQSKCDANDIGAKVELFNNLLDFKPSILLVDGLDADWSANTIKEWTQIARQHDCMIWITTTSQPDCPHTLEILESDTGISIRNKETSVNGASTNDAANYDKGIISPKDITLFSGGTMGAEVFLEKSQKVLAYARSILHLKGTNKREPWAELYSTTKS